MARINFDEFVLFKSIDGSETEVLNVRRVFAKELYTRGQGIECHALALKIFNGDGAQEFSAEECRLMTVFAEQIMTPNFIDSLNFLISSSNEKG